MIENALFNKKIQYNIKTGIVIKKSTEINMKKIRVKNS